MCAIFYVHMQSCKYRFKIYMRYLQYIQRWGGRQTCSANPKIFWLLKVLRLQYQTFRKCGKLRICWTRFLLFADLLFADPKFFANPQKYNFCPYQYKKIWSIKPAHEKDRKEAELFKRDVSSVLWWKICRFAISGQARNLLIWN